MVRPQLCRCYELGMVDEVKDGREKFELSGRRERDLVRNAIRWHMTGCDGGIRSDDTGAVWDHGWTGEEKARIEEILCNGTELSKVLLAWCRHDEAKCVSRQNTASRQDVHRLLTGNFFVAVRKDVNG